MPTQSELRAIEDKKQHDRNAAAVRDRLVGHPDGELLTKVLGLDGAYVRVAKGKYQP